MGQGGEQGNETAKIVQTKLPDRRGAMRTMFGLGAAGLALVGVSHETQQGAAKNRVKVAKKRKKGKGDPAGSVGTPGPAGADGAQGPQGPQGATGPRGENGASVPMRFEHVTEQFSVSDETPTGHLLTCPSGGIAVGGGVVSMNARCHVFMSHPPAPEQWEVGIYCPAGQGGETSNIATVVCAYKA
jgi:hypothetical protein